MDLYITVKNFTKYYIETRRYVAGLGPWNIDWIPACILFAVVQVPRISELWSGRWSLESLPWG